VCPTTVGGTVHTPHGALGGSLTLTRDTVTRRLTGSRRQPKECFSFPPHV